MFYSFVRGLAKVILHLLYRFELTGKENIPKGTRAVLAPNHIHWLDPVVVACMVTAREISFMGKQELFRIPVLSWILKKLTVIPVRRGEADVTAIKSALRTLKSEGILGIFPEGTRVKEGEEKAPQGGAAVLALKANAPILPISIAGTYKFRSTIKVHIGKPMNLQEYKNTKITRETTEMIGNEIMKQIKDLGTGR